MLWDRLTTLLGLLSGVCLPTGSGRPGPRHPPQSWAATNQTQPWVDPLQPWSSLGTWMAFLGLQKTKQLGTSRVWRGQEVAAAVSLPLDPQEVTHETCKAVPFIQVLSRPGCTPARVRNRLCFGRCFSLYVPGSAATPRVLSNSCVPARRRRVPVVLWCSTGSPAWRRRVKVSTELVQECQCIPKP
ncbi:DAN domain family member 5 [Perognathus longimembris pacificus]|uniref:DAN domain family member 5 n=1 Tax=Perognathus longimembris pacificus TaxID=214514 RepID=UPI002018AB73|nr:DAN domain family member 5 [Perognathus longimembris pacificus]